MKRLVFSVLFAVCAFAAAQAADKAPFRVLFSNDTTNIISNVSPFHKRGESFRPEMLEASVDETAGCVDVHMLQPGADGCRGGKARYALPTSITDG